MKTAFQSFDNLKTVLRRARRDKSIDTTLTFSNRVLYFAGTGNYGNYGKSRVHVRVTPKGLRGTTLHQSRRAESHVDMHMDRRISKALLGLVIDTDRIGP